MTAQEQFANQAVSALAALMGTGDTTLTVAAPATFPTAPQFRLLVDDELMLVTGVAGALFTVTRGIEGTTAAQHTQGATVTHIITAGGLLAAIGGQPIQKGKATLGGSGTVTVTGVTLTSSSVIIVSRNTAAGSIGHLSAPDAQRNIGAGSFQIASSSASETSTVDWLVIG